MYWLGLGVLVIAVSLPACTASPEVFAKETIRQGCKYQRDCDGAEWDAEGFDSIRDCTEAREGNGDAFVELCGELDEGRARACLRELRETRRECRSYFDTDEQIAACEDLCSDAYPTFVNEIGPSAGLDG